MPVHLAAPLPADIHGVPGVRIGVAEAGIRKVGRKDLTVFLLDEGTAVAGVFTRNRFCAAPVQVCPVCKKGTMVQRSGPYGPFLGCTSYPACRNTRRL